MEPSYIEGDHVLTFNWINIGEKDVIVFKYLQRYLIKRVEKIENGKIYIHGDNRKLSIKLKPIAAGQVVGRVLLKY